uniref:hemicentin-1 n=1 Tax=Maylandia zebra TaxID=106582 RepID=UPI000D3116A4|nr:hemicentin-1 [Maylandia zebra]
MRGAAMSVTAAALSGFIVLLLTVPAVLGQTGWSVTSTSTHICALKGSTVDIGCSYSYPNNRNRGIMFRERLWFIRNEYYGPVDLRTDPDYTGRVEHQFHEKDCTLRITDLRESDSAEYKFRFMTNQYGGSYTGSPGVTLTVTDLQVKRRKSSAHTELQCHSSCDVIDPPSYVWYKNGQKIEEETSLRVSVGGDDSSYSCAVKGHEGYRSAAVYVPKLPSVSVSPSAEIVEGSSVTLTCSSDANPAANYTWYKEDGQTPLSKEWWLSFSSIQPSDSGQYYCTAENDLGKRTSESVLIDVKYAPKPPSVSVRPSGEIKEGGSVTLTCSSEANPAATFVWYKISGRTPLSEERQLVFRSIQPSDSGQYYCIAVNKLGRRTSEYISIDGKYAPKFVSVMLSPSNEFREGGSVTLTCSSDANPAAQYSWYKKNGQKPLSSEQQLSFSSIQPSDSGEYYCTAQNKVGRKKSEYTSIDVKYDPKLPSVSVSPSGEIKEGTGVTLTCSSDANPAAQYSWYKKNGQKPLSNERQLSFSSIQSSDSGQYYCTAVNKLGSKLKSIAIDVKYAPKPPSVSVSPSGEIKENVSVTLTCSSDANPAAAYVWYKMNNQTPVSTDSQLSFKSIQPADSGEYYCTAENRLGTSTPTNISVDVKYNPKSPSVSVSPSGEITEGTAVTLTCSSDANPGATYVWYKRNSQPLSKNPQLIFSSIQSSDSEEYYCRAVNKLGSKLKSITIDVKYAPKPPSVSVSPSGEITEGTSVTLTCSSDANPAATYVWYKMNNQTPVSTDSQLSFKSIQPADSGEYYCTVENRLGTSTPTNISVDVKYAPKPPSVSVRPSGEIKEGTSVTLTCSSEANPAATFVWYKTNGRTPLSKEPQLVFRSIEPSDSGQYYCIAANTVGTTSEYISINVNYAPKFVSVMVNPSNEFREGGSVTLICSSDANPAAQYSWYKKNGQKPLSNEQQLSFSSIQPSDSGEYYCTAQNKVGRKKSEYTSIDVKYDPKPPSVSVSPSGEITEGTAVTLTCSSDANPAATYVWYKRNSQPLGKNPQLIFSSIQSSDSGEYYCRAVNKLGSTLKSITIDVKYAPKPPSVSVSPSGEITEGTSVTLTCSSDANPAATYVWYKMNNQTPVNTDSQLSFKSIQPADSGEYYCTAENRLGTSTPTNISVDVKYAPKPPSVSVRPSGEIKEGTSVTLTCSSDANPAATFVWYKTNGRTPLSKEPQLVFRSIEPSDSGQYYCIAANTVGTTSEYISIKVNYAPKFVSVMVSPSNEFREGGSVTLTCSSDANPAAQYSWYKKNGQKPLSSEQQLSFSSIQSSDSGEYYCTVQNKVGRKKSEYTSIDVKYDPKPPSVSVSPSGEITEGTGVTLTCSSDANPAATFVWYKRNSQALGKNPQLIFNSIQSSDSGEYYCRAVNKLGSTFKSITIVVKYAPKPPSVSVSPSGEIKEGTSVTLTCVSEANPAATYVWYKMNNQTSVSTDSQLSFKSIQPADSGEYYCTAENRLGTSTPTNISVDVKYGPKPPSVSVRPSGEIKEGTSVTLTCSSEANPAATFVWYKTNGRTPLSKEPQLVFRSIEPSDSGQYYCIAANTVGTTSEYVSINVNYAPKFVSVMVSPSNEFREGGSVTLICSSDANPAAQYSWYKKNGQKPLSNEQQLSFSSIQPSDSGEYYCTAQNKVGRKKSEYTSIDVKYAPKPPSVSVRPSGEIKEGGSVTLTCSSDANPAATYVWYKTNGRTPLSKEPELAFRSIEPSDSGQYYCIAGNTLGRKTSEYTSIDVKYAPKSPSAQKRGAAMSATAAARIEFVFVLLLTASVSDVLCVTAVLGQNGWSVTYTSTHICALKKSTVDIGCSYSYPSTRHNMNTAVQKRLWSIKNKDEPLDLKTYAPYSRRAEYRFHENDCTLRITDLRERDSDEYKFRFVTNQPDGSYTGSPGVTLTVTDLQVKVRRLLSHTELQCHSSCDVIDPPSYVWYKNGQKIEEETSLRVSVGGDDSSYSCAVKGHEGYRSAAVFSPKLYYVLVNPSAEAEEGTSVSLNCGFNANPAANYSWYKGNIQTRISEGTVLDFSSIQPSDSGEYYCTAENELGRSASQSIFINVKYAPKPVNVSVTPSGEIVEGNSVTLTCSSDANPAAKYTWYKGNNNKPQSVDTQLVFTSIQRSESGQYRCRAYNSVGATSDTISIHVKYPPKFVSVSVSPSNEISEGSSVTLTCSSDAKPTANHFWYKDGDQTPLINERQLSITSIQSFDSGEYVCAAENHLGRTTSESIFIVVIYAPKSLSVLFSPSGEIQEGNSVNLTCSSDANPAANYTWYKENSQTPLVVEPQLSFISIQPTDSGEYYCQAVNKVNTSTPKYISIHVAYAPRPLSMSVSPSGEILEGNSVTLTCSSDANPAAKYTWYKTNNQTPLIKEPQLIFSSIQSSDSGEYYCTAENKLGVSSPTYNISINVTYAPKLPSVSVSPSAEIVEGSSVTLTCSSDANPAANYTWYKEDEESPKTSGQNFTITDFRPEHSGSYYCVAQNTRGHHYSTLQLTVVSRAWKLTAVIVPAILLGLILLYSVILWIIKNRSSKQQQPEPREELDTSEQTPSCNPPPPHLCLSHVTQSSSQACIFITTTSL